MMRTLVAGLLALATADVALAQGRPIRPIRPLPFPQPGIEQVEYKKRPLDELLKMIKTKEGRLEAAMGLADHGAEAAPAIADLGEVIKSGDDELRLNAAIALGKIGKQSIETATTLAASDDANVRFYAIWTFGLIGPDAKSSASLVAKALADKNEGVRRKAAFSLGRLGLTDADTIELLVRSLEEDANQDVRTTAADALSKIGEKAVPSLVRAFEKSDKPEINLAILHAFEEIGSDAKDAVPAIQKKFLNEKANVHQYAHALAKIGKAGLPALVAGAKSDDQTIRQTSIGQIGQVNPEGAPILIDLLGDKNADVRRQAIHTLAQMRVGDKSVVVAFAYSLKDTDEGVRQGAIQGIQILGPLGKPAAPKVKELLADVSPQIRQQAFYTLQNMGENPRDALTKLLDSKDEQQRIGIAALMMQMNFEQNLAQPVLIEGLTSGNKTARVQAASTLAMFRRESDKVVPILIEGLKDNDASIRQQALNSLQQVQGANIKEHFGVIAPLAKDPNDQIRMSVAGMLGNAQDETAVELLTDLIKDKNQQVKYTALYSLNRLGPKASKAIPALAEVMTGNDQQSRQIAMIALMQTGKEGQDLVLKTYQSTTDGQAKADMLRQMVFSGRQRDQALPLVKEAIKDKLPPVRQAAVQCLQNFAYQNQEAFDLLAKATTDEDKDIRVQAIYHVQNFGAKAFPALEEAIKSAKDTQTRQAVLQGLANYGYRNKVVVPAVILCLKDGQAQVRWTACQVLSNIGPDAAEAASELERLKEDSDPNVRNFAAQALARVRPEKK